MPIAIISPLGKVVRLGYCGKNSKEEEDSIKPHIGKGCSLKEI